jgi:hypothetical protein
VGVTAKIASGATDWQARAQLVDAAGSVIGSAGSFVDLVPGATAARAKLAITNPTQAGGSGVQIQFRRKTAATSTIRAGDLTIEAGNTDGSWFTPRWIDPQSGQLGTVHASPSVSQAVAWVEEGTTNLIVDPLTNNTPTGETLRGAGGNTVGVDYGRVTTFAKSGTGAWFRTGDGANSARGLNHYSAAGLGLTGTARPFAGQIALRVTGGPADITATVTLTYTDASADSATPVVTNVGDGWAVVKLGPVVANPAKTVDRVRVNWNFVGVAGAGVTAYATDVQIDDNKSVATSFCAGSLGTGYAWTGTAHASSSVRTKVALTFDETNRGDARSGAIVARAQRLYDSGAYQVILQIGSSSVTCDMMTLAVDSSDKLAAEPVEGGAASTARQSVASAPVASWFTAYAEWTSATAGVGLDGAALVSGARNTPVGTFVNAGANAAIGENRFGIAQLDGLIGPIAIFARPLTARERTKLATLTQWDWRSLDAA